MMKTTNIPGHINWKWDSTIQNLEKLETEYNLKDLWTL